MLPFAIDPGQILTSTTMQKQLNLILLEDRQEDVDLVILELRSSGFEIAWRRVQTREDFTRVLTPDVDLILADYNLPRFSAPEALKILQETDIDAPFIVLTGSISEEVAVDCMKKGATDYLLKDRLSRLNGAISFALEQRDLRRAQREAERSMIIKDRALDTSINAVVMADLTGQITYTNQAFHDLWGCDPGTNGIKTIDQLWEPVEEGKQVIESLRAGRSARGEMASRRLDGRPLILGFTASLVTDSDGEQLCIMGIFVDQTEQKEAEKARQEAEILKIQLEKERELRELKSRFVSMLVHDFRNPLSILQVYLNLLRKYPERLSLEARNEKLDKMMVQTEQMNQLIDDILVLGQIEDSRLDFVPIPGDMTSFCEDTFTDFYVTHDAPDLEYEFCGHDLTLASFDPNLMLRALTNLLSNAVKYSPNGGKIRFEVAAAGEHVRLTLSDQGIGIPAEDTGRLFEGFHRGSNVGHIQGTGLGLAIVRQIVELHGGTIRCESAIGRGSTFIIEMPHGESGQNGSG